MSLADLITNLTITLKKHVDNNNIDDITMLTILTDTLKNFCTKLNAPQFNLYQKTKSNIFNEFNPIILSNNTIIKPDINTTDINLTPPSTMTGDNSFKNWCDYASDDDFCLNVNELDVSSVVDKKVNEKNKRNDVVPYCKKNNYCENKPHKSNINIDALQKYQKNCERTITYFIKNYKVGHFDSAKNIQDLNLIIVRLLGINFNDNIPQAYSSVCWFMRNTRCYYTDCVGNNYNMCTYAHPKNYKTIQYCCVDDDEYDPWPDNYYKCLKMDFNDDVNVFINQNGNKLLPINTYKSIPPCIIEWYEYMTELLLNND